MKIFVTVGTALQPFDRLLRAVDEALRCLGRPYGGLCQHGPSLVRPVGLRAVFRLCDEEFRRALREADVVICHAGVGTLASAIRAGHRPLVMARLADKGEIVNDHQLEILRLLAVRGLVTPVRDAADLCRGLERNEAEGTRVESGGSAGPGLLAVVAADLGMAPGRFAISSAARRLVRLVGRYHSGLAQPFLGSLQQGAAELGERAAETAPSDGEGDGGAAGASDE